MPGKNSLLEEMLQAKQGPVYDCAVMFSGGKDSTYLLYLMKRVYGKKVIAVTVDNGFERDCTFEAVKNMAGRLEVPGVVLNPGKECFKTFFESAFRESELFAQYKDKNHICYVCSILLWGCVMKYASENQIPYVVCGHDIAQLNIGEGYSNKLVEKGFKLGAHRILELVRKTHNYKTNEQYREFIENTLSIPSGVMSVFPFVHIDYNVGHIKSILEREIGWKPPTGQDIGNYISSGCKIISMLYRIEDLNITHLKERQEIKKLVEGKALEEEFIRYIDGRNRPVYVDLRNSVIDELGIRELLVEKCGEMGFVQEDGRMVRGKVT